MKLPHKILVPLDAAVAWQDGRFILTRKYDGESAVVQCDGVALVCERMKRRSGQILTASDRALLADGEFLAAFDLESTAPAGERWARLGELFAGQRVKTLPDGQRLVLAESGAAGSYVGDVLAAGGEGVCAKEMDAPFWAPFYAVKRSENHDLLVVEIDIARGSIVLATVDGEARGRCYAPAVCEKVSVGDVVEIAAAGITASGKLREPRFIRIRADKTAKAA
jgi:ATP-dependent DNA ligase